MNEHGKNNIMLLWFVSCGYYQIKNINNCSFVQVSILNVVNCYRYVNSYYFSIYYKIMYINIIHNIVF